MVTVPGTEGYMGVMAGHAPLISTLRAGMIDVNVDGKDDRFFIRGGFAEISPPRSPCWPRKPFPMTELDLAVLDQRINDAEEDEIAAKTDADRQQRRPARRRPQARSRGFLIPPPASLASRATGAPHLKGALRPWPATPPPFGLRADARGRSARETHWRVF